MDSTFVIGTGAVISAVIIFCGSVWLLLTMVLGARLAYFVSASVTLAFVLIMALVWGFTNQGSPLGPVGESRSWSGTAIGEDVSNFGYPDGDWRVPSEDNEEDTLLSGEFEGDAVDYLERSIEEEKEGIDFGEVDDGTVDSDATRLIEMDGETFGATTIQPVEGAEAIDGGTPDPVVVVMEFDPGSPLQTGRLIAGGTFVLLVVHLLGLSWAERKAKAGPAAEVV